MTLRDSYQLPGPDKSWLIILEVDTFIYILQMRKLGFGVKTCLMWYNKPWSDLDLKKILTLEPQFLAALLLEPLELSLDTLYSSFGRQRLAS